MDFGGGWREMWYWINYSFPNRSKVQRDPPNAEYILIADLSVPSISNHLAEDGNTV